MKRRTSHDSRGNNKRPSYHHDKPSKSSSASSNNSEDEGHLYAKTGDLLYNRYEVISVMGTGTFGKVFACNDRKHRDIVAIKVIRSVKRYIESSLIEADILSYVVEQQKKSKVHYFVKLYSKFYTSSGHLGLVFEPLGISLYDLVKKNGYVGLPLSQVKSISHQLLHAMSFLHSINLIHTDLKLENILFVSNNFTKSLQNNGRQLLLPVDPIIKIIDFGGATYDDKHKSTIISTRQYRGPEVTLECGWSFPSDIWSIGCMIAEIYDGDLLFPTHDDLEHLCLIEKFLDIAEYSSSLLAKSPIRHRFFDSANRLRYSDLSTKSKSIVHEIKRIDSYFNIQNGDNESGIIELIRELLRFNPAERITADKALNMSFFL